MQLTLPVGRFSVLAKQALQFAEAGRGVDPGLSLIHVEVTNPGSMRVSAHDAGSGTKIMTKVTDSEPGDLAVGSDQLDKLVSILPDSGEVRLQLISESRARVLVGRRLKMDVPVYPASQFTPMPRAPKDGWFEIVESDVDKIIRRCLWATGGDESRPTLSGIHLCSECSESTDGHVMSRLTPGLVPKGVDVVVPADSWQRLRSLVEAGKNRLRMCVESNRVWLRSSTWGVYSQLVAGKFPDTGDMVFEVDGDNIHHLRGQPMRVHSINVNRHEFLSVVKRIGGASVSQEERRIGASVAFDLRDDQHLHLVSNYPFDDVSNSIIVDEQADWVEDSVTADDTSGFERLRDVGIYSYYMRQALSALSSDVVKIMWADAPVIGNMPMQFHDPDAGIVSLVMPRRL